MAFKKNPAWARYVVSSLFGCFRLLPHRLAVSAGAFLGRTLWLFSKRKVDRAEARCVAALGVGVTVARSIVRSSYANMGRSCAEFMRLQLLRPRIRALVAIEGKEHLEEALARGRGVLLMTAHIGSWELCGARLAEEGFTLAPIYTPQRNTGGLEDHIRRQRTEGAGFNVIPSGGFALREVFKSLGQGGVVIVLQDLDARKEGVSVPFLGLPASTAAGLVKMYRKFEAPVVPALAIRKPDGRHLLSIQSPLSDLRDEDGDPFGANMEKSLKMCNNILGDWVRTYPDQWLWLLDRWKSSLGPC